MTLDDYLEQELTGTRAAKLSRPVRRLFQTRVVELWDQGLRDPDEITKLTLAYVTSEIKTNGKRYGISVIGSILILILVQVVASLIVRAIIAWIQRLRPDTTQAVAA